MGESNFIFGVILGAIVGFIVAVIIIVVWNWFNNMMPPTSGSLYTMDNGFILLMGTVVGIILGVFATK